MEDFRHISRLAEIHGRRGEELETLQREPLANLAPRLNLRRVLLSLTVVILGMAAWWGQ
jgi:hypothetical protein